ncbi:MAG: isoprenylcysteine carboxylmethyltransferase family protein, partial [Gemmatimonadota bacterium]|nr:isoprenylcysteine carboxylmethyltransferase family protein [Gemmatimonadota bacterium]
LGLVAGWLLNRYVYPLPIPSSGNSSMWKLADIIILVGVALTASGMVTFKRARTAIIPNRSASRVVVTGPYRFTRNPMYTGMTIAYSGASLLIASLWPLIALPVVLLVIYRTVIQREERYLTDAFGAEYTDYCGRVRRWM